VIALDAVTAALLQRLDTTATVYPELTEREAATRLVLMGLACSASQHGGALLRITEAGRAEARAQRESRGPV